MKTISQLIFESKTKNLVEAIKETFTKFSSELKENTKAEELSKQEEKLRKLLKESDKHYKTKKEEEAALNSGEAIEVVLGKVTEKFKSIAHHYNQTWDLEAYWPKKNKSIILSKTYENNFFEKPKHKIEHIKSSSDLYNELITSIIPVKGLESLFNK